MTDLELLRGIRELIGVPKRWTKEASARDAAGRLTMPDSNRATCWCMLGAAMKLQPRDVTVTVIDAKTSRALGVPDVTEFNDTHTHAEVIALLDRRIAELETASA